MSFLRRNFKSVNHYITELPVLTRGNSRANSPESYESSDSDVPPDSFKLSPSTEQNIYAHRFDELERKRGMKTHTHTQNKTNREDFLYF